MVRRLIHEPPAWEMGQPLLLFSSLYKLIWFDWCVCVYFEHSGLAYMLPHVWDIWDGFLSSCNLKISVKVVVFIEITFPSFNVLMTERPLGVHTTNLCPALLLWAWKWSSCWGLLSSVMSCSLGLILNKERYLTLAVWAMIVIHVVSQIKGNIGHFEVARDSGSVLFQNTICCCFEGMLLCFLSVSTFVKFWRNLV